MGSRADVFLGSGTTGTVALKVFHDDVGADDIGRELDALSRLDSPHFVRLRDVASGDDERPILILERLQQWSVASLLRDRDSLERGEVVTILAPLAAELGALHRCGVGHGGIGPARVYFGNLGEPILLGFGHSRRFAAGASIAAIDAEPAALTDRQQLAALAVTLLGRVRNAATDDRVVSLMRWIDDSPRRFEFAGELEAALFEAADPLPINLERESMPATHPVPSRSVPLRSVPSRSVPAPDLDVLPERDLPATGHSPGNTVVGSSPLEHGTLGLLGRLDMMLRDNPIEAGRARAREFIRGVRKPFWIIGAGVAVALVAALSVLPEGSPAPPGAVPSASAPSSAPLPSPSPLPDDPLLAIGPLLLDRSECIRAMSVLCLDGVDDQGSSAYASDAATIQQIQAGSEIPKSSVLSAPSPTLVESLGDTVLVRPGPDSNPASVLMIRTEAGWRIRGYLTGIPSTGTPSGTG